MDGSSVSWLQFRDQQTWLGGEAEQIVLGKRAVELFRSEPVFAFFERQHVPLVAPPIKDVDRSGRIVARNHLQKQNALGGLDPACSDRFADVEEFLRVHSRPQTPHWYAQRC